VEPVRADHLADEWNLLRPVLDLLPIAVVVQRGPELVYAYANPRAEALLPAWGRLVGRTIRDVYPDMADVQATMWGRALAGEVVFEPAFAIALTGDRQAHDGERFYDLTLAPLFEQGRVAGVLTAFEAVTGGARARGADLERRLAREHEALSSLQRALLPRELPRVAGWELAATYEPASRSDVVGGDFYDVLPWRDKTLLALGDVSGKGAVAAGITAEARGALRALAAQGLPLVETLRWIDRMLTLEGDDFCTLGLAVLDPEDPGRVSVVLAGHPPLVRLRGDGRRGSIVGKASPPLGTGLPLDPCSDEVDVAAGDTLLLYSDGLLEAHAPARLIDPRDLPALLSPLGRLELGQVLDSVRSRLVGGPGDRRDDLAILAARRTLHAGP
jgi:hypothetical protein